MYELGVPDYVRVRPLFQAMEFHLAVTASLESSTRAKIYADHPDRPQAAIAWTGRRLYLVGSEGNRTFGRALRRLFTETVYPHTLQSSSRVFMLYYAPDSWETQLERVLQDMVLNRGLREFYVLKQLEHDWRPVLPEGFVLRSVDRALLDQRHLENLELLIEEICSERASVEDFLDKSFGVCLLHNDTIVGWCLSEYNSGHRCEVGIGTLEPYRRRGLATSMAWALVEQALLRGISSVGWHCWANNAPSVATALRVGFQKVRDYPVFLARFES